MDPFVRLWLYNSWAYEQELEIEKLRNHALYIGSFSNPEMANTIIRKENPQFKTSDEDFEKSMEIVRNSINEEMENKNKRVSKRRQRKIIE